MVDCEYEPLVHEPSFAADAGADAVVPLMLHATAIAHSAACVVNVNVRLAVRAVGNVLSVSRIVTDEVPNVDGVPVMRPAVVMLSPVGSAPDVTAKVYGCTPSVPASWSETDCDC
jgi:hypothetical protein